MPFNFTGGTDTRPRSYVFAVVLLVVSLLCSGMYVREGEEGPLHSVQNVISSLFGPLKSASGTIASVEDGIGDGLANSTADDATLSGLRQQNEELRQTIAQLEEYRQEAQRLEGLLGMKDLYDADVVGARVLSRTLDPWSQIVTIDKGTDDGVRAGLPVMSSTGLVGQIASTTASTSEVRLLEDPQSGISVVIQSSRVEGIVRGNLDGLLYLEDIDDDAEVKPGDVVISSGLGGGYFQGIMVGTISKVEGEPGTASRKIVVESNAHAKPTGEVMVVVAMHAGSVQPTGESTEDGQGDTADDSGYADDAYDNYDDSSDDYGEEDGDYV